MLSILCLGKGRCLNQGVYVRERLGRIPSTVRPVLPLVSDKEIPFTRALRRLPSQLGSQVGIHLKNGTFTAWNRTQNRTRTPPEKHWAQLKGGQNVPTSKASRGWPLGKRFWRPSENGF